MGTYAAAQLSAGSKSLHVLFGWDLSIGAWLGAVIVLLYCIAGGIRASIWTDVAQSVVMFAAMLMMVWTGVDAAGGFDALLSSLNAVSSTYMSVMPPGLPEPLWLGFSLYLLGWLAAGFGIIGQPHIMVRFMAMESAEKMTEARYFYYGLLSPLFALECFCPTWLILIRSWPCLLWL